MAVAGSASVSWGASPLVHLRNQRSAGTHQPDIPRRAVIGAHAYAGDHQRIEQLLIEIEVIGMDRSRLNGDEGCFCHEIAHGLEQILDIHIHDPRSGPLQQGELFLNATATISSVSVKRRPRGTPIRSPASGIAVKGAGSSPAMMASVAAQSATLVASGPIESRA